MFLVVVDAHSRWPEVEKMSSTTSDKTMDTLQMLFARFGVCAQLVIVQSLNSLFFLKSETEVKYFNIKLQNYCCL